VQRHAGTNHDAARNGLGTLGYRVPTPHGAVAPAKRSRIIHIEIGLKVLKRHFIQHV
jgi:hypothetical protein